MEIITMSIMLGFALILFGLSKLVKDPIFIFISGITILFVGLSVFVGGIDIKNGFFEDYNTTINDNQTISQSQTTYTYIEKNPIINHGFGGVLIWLSIYILIVGWSMYKNDKEERLLG